MTVFINKNKKLTFYAIICKIIFKVFIFKIEFTFVQ